MITSTKIFVLVITHFAINDNSHQLSLTLLQTITIKLLDNFKQSFRVTFGVSCTRI